MRDVSIIIPVHNEENNIGRAIESLINQDYKGNIEVLVLDDGSTDNTKQIVKAYPQAKYYQITKPGSPQGKTKTVNQGIKLTKNEIIGVLDADSYMDKNAIRNMVGEFENDKTGAVVPIVKVDNPKHFLERMQVIEYTLSMCIRKLVSNTGSLFMTHGVGTLFNKKALKKAGYFKEDTLTEDLNIGLKLIKAGYNIKSSFKAIGYTQVPKTLKHVVKQRLRWNGGLFENSYWHKDMYFNKSYGNLGLFVMPFNLAWSGITVYVAALWIKDLIKDISLSLRDLIITNFDWSYFITSKLRALLSMQLNELSIISILPVIFFLLFYLLVSSRIKMGFKDSLISYLLMPLYFTVFFLISTVTLIITPAYMKKRGGKPWLTDKV
jgi:cellulose synthase/poly-beta-1,6-N-acetylglucosamine synthase-like glycosyltransferase